MEIEEHRASFQNSRKYLDYKGNEFSAPDLCTTASLALWNSTWWISLFVSFFSLLSIGFPTCWKNHLSSVLLFHLCTYLDFCFILFCFCRFTSDWVSATCYCASCKKMEQFCLYLQRAYILTGETDTSTCL